MEQDHHEVESTGEVANAADSEVSLQEQPQADQSPDMVPVTALQAERRERQQLQEQMKMLQDHVSLMQSNQTQAPAKDEYDGLQDDDVLTVREAKKFMGQIKNDYKTSVEELRVQQKYPDYNEIVTQYLPDVIKKNPALKSTLQKDENKYELAYFLAKNSDTYRETSRAVKKSTDAQRIVENGQKAGSLSAVGMPTSQSKVSSMRNMSDSDFMKMANKNLGRF